MILNNPAEQVTKELILSKVSEYSIYRYYVGQDIKLGVAICSVFRRDRTPSMSIYVGEDGHLHHIDYADDRYRGSCIDIVMQLYQLSYKEAIKKIAQDMGIVNGNNEYKKIVSQYIEPVIDRRRNAFIQVVTKKLSPTEEKWWNQYGITKEQLQQDNVYSLKEVYVNKRKYYTDKHEPVYGYWYPEGIKVYMPTRQKNEKWLSSITTSLVEGTDKINGQSKVIVTKAKKDRLTLEGLFPDILILNTQNESMSCWSDKLIDKIKDKQIYINYDRDTAGKQASIRVNQKYPYMKHINVPDEYDPIKDYSDLYKELGPEPIIKHWKQKGII